MILTTLLLGLVIHTSGGQPTDAVITIETKLRMLVTGNVPSNDVSVDTVDGMVTLYGTVATEGEKRRADAEARRIEGVLSVRDLLQVAPNVPTVESPSDADIKRHIETALKTDKSLAKNDFKVKGVDNGLVLLAGHARALTDHLRAVETAYAVTGVKSVHSEIQSPNHLADEDIWHDRWDDPAKAFSGAHDVWTTNQIKLRLLADSHVPALAINVDTRAGIVTLFGSVDSDDAKRAAGADASAIKGVRDVHNQLEVVAAAKESAAQDDSKMQQAIETAFAKVGASAVQVSLANGVAHLSGHVSSNWDRVHLATIARQTRGVSAVDDGLVVKP